MSTKIQYNSSIEAKLCFEQRQTERHMDWRTDRHAETRIHLPTKKKLSLFEGIMKFY